MSARRRERPVQSGASNRSSARSARLSASKSAPNLHPGLPSSNNSRVAGGAGMASVRSEELWGEKATESAPETVTARGTREGFMNEKKGYYYEGSWHPRTEPAKEQHKVSKELYDMGLKDRRYKGFFPPAHGRENRRLAAATWNQSVLPSARHWETEMQAAAKGEYDDAYYFFDRMEAKKDLQEEGHDFHSFNKARNKLAELAVVKYGSISNMFREFDDDKSGQISLDEFSKAMKKRNLEPMFSREAQRVLFSYLDKDSSDSLELQEFVKFFDEPDAREGEVDKVDLTTVKKLSPRLQRIKDSLVEKLHSRRRNAKLLDGMEYATQQLLNTFRHIDEDGSGELDVKELHKALGPSYLNLDMTTADVNHLMKEMDVNHDGRVNFKEFIKFLEVHDIDPGYNPFFDGRQRVLTKLRSIESQPWHFGKETQDTVDAFNTINDRRNLDTKMKSVTETFTPDSADSGPPRFAKTTQSMNKTATMTETQGLANVRSSDELFGDMNATKAFQMSQICPRFVPQPPTDYTRTGLGGNGIKQKSGLFMKPDERFTTTNDVYYCPLVYEPNQPVVRNTISDASLSTLAREQRLEFRKARIKKTVDMTKARIHLSETMSKMDSEQRLKMKATEMYGYFKGLYRKDKEMERKANGMHKKPEFNMYDRMWNGSKQNPFHHENRFAVKLDRGLWNSVASDIGAEVHKAEPNLPGSHFLMKKTHIEAL